jgi:hypothetical protein
MMAPGEEKGQSAAKAERQFVRLFIRGKSEKQFQKIVHRSRLCAVYRSYGNTVIDTVYRSNIKRRLIYNLLFLHKGSYQAQDGLHDRSEKSASAILYLYLA